MSKSIARKKKRKSSTRVLRKRFEVGEVILYYLMTLVIISLSLLNTVHNSRLLVPEEKSLSYNNENATNKYTQYDEKDAILDSVSLSSLDQRTPILSASSDGDTIRTIAYDAIVEDESAMADDIENVVKEVNAINNIEVIDEIIVEDDAIIVNYFDLYTPVLSSSGLSIDDISELIKDTALSGIESDVYNIEKENGVNAYYTLAVASLESGYGTSSMARNQNNLFGMMGKSFNTKSEGVEYFGNLMTSYFDNGIEPTCASINKRYCELDSWKYKVVNIMNTYASKVA